MTGTLPASGVSQIGAGQTLVLTSAQKAANLEALTAAANATLVLQQASTDDATQEGKFKDKTETDYGAVTAGKVKADTYKYQSGNYWKGTTATKS